MRSRPARPTALTILAATFAAAAWSLAGGSVSATETIVVRGQAQGVHTYGARGGVPVIVSSGDGGWIHLGPHIAEMLAAHGFFVVGFDVKSYLAGFTATERALRPEDVPGDYRVLLDYAAAGARTRPVLVGVSEGAGLSILAATDARVHAAAEGVVGVGVPATSELGWRWRDSVIYLTHGVPDEPTFNTLPVIGNVTPLPLAAILSSHDEFVTREDTARMLEHAAEPKRLWMVAASDHRFSDNLGGFDATLLEALAWVHARATR